MALFTKIHHIENQRKLTTKKVIEGFKAKGTILSEQVFKLYNASKTCNPIEFNSIEPKKQPVLIITCSLLII